ncbi:MAG: hypothetical protein HY074_03755 [Deltaproteobacteria bacterium]|nr:hypothetical protein [Deltaproteobacteria bacterium]
MLGFFLVTVAAATAFADDAPVLDGDRLIDAFRIEEPMTSFDEGASASARSTPLIFTMDANVLRRKLSANGIGRVTFSNGRILTGTAPTAKLPPPLAPSRPSTEPMPSIYAKPPQHGSSCLLFVSRPPFWKDGLFTFTVSSAYWPMKRSSPSDSAHSRADSLLACGLFELSDVNSAMTLKCWFSDCFMTVGGLREALSEVQLDIKAADSDGERGALAAEDEELPDRLEFEKAPYKTTAKKQSAAKAAATAAAEAAKLAKPAAAAAVVVPKPAPARVPASR